MFETPLGVELLFSGCEVEFLATIGAVDGLVLVLHVRRLSRSAYKV
jgi:hypothetical protein